jgi:hypothetical protein
MASDGLAFPTSTSDSPAFASRAERVRLGTPQVGVDEKDLALAEARVRDRLTEVSVLPSRAPWTSRR